MSQEYEPVTWQDETTGQQGTLINAERLDQMQTAHHYADGWEEVDAVPSGDPGVDYHKVVYCTADSTFYRWDGEEWTKDVDDVTKAELDAEIERATLAEEALDSAKADKATTLAGYGITDAYTKAQTDTLLAGKMDDGDAYTKAETDTLLADKADVSALTDGSVTKLGTADVGGDLYPIKLVAGVPTAVANALVDTATAQTIGGVKTFTSALTVTGADLTVAEDSGTGGGITAKTVDTTGNVTIGGALAVTGAITGSLTGPATKLGTVDLGTDTKPIKLVAGVPTAVTNDLVSTTGAQTIGGNKTLTNTPTILSTFPEIDLKNSNLELNTAPSTTQYGLAFIRDKDGNEVSSFGVRKTSGNVTEWYTYARASSSVNATFGMKVSASEKYLYGPNRTYNASNTTDVVNIASLQASSDVVHTSGAETINGSKIFVATPTVESTINAAPASNAYRNIIQCKNTTNNYLGCILTIEYRPNGTSMLYAQVRNSDGTIKNVVLAQGVVV